MAKIAILIPYFGELPRWMDLYICSVNKNKILDVIFYTDCEIPNCYKEISNIKWKNISFYDYCMLVSNKLGIEFVPSKAYKLCDVRPFLGFIHESDLIGYDFWGYGDIDLIYGDMTKLLTSSVLESYDVISTNIARLSGPFCLFRNIDYYRKVCFKIKNWKRKLMDDKNHILDERAFSNIVCPFRKYVNLLCGIISRILRVSGHDEIGFYIQRCMHGALRPIYRLKKIYMVESFASHTAIPSEIMSDYFVFKEWTYEDGKIVGRENGKYMEFIYLHFLFLKKTEYLKSHIYWEEGYYHVPLLKSLSFLNDKIVLINHQGIYLRSKDNSCL